MKAIQNYKFYISLIFLSIVLLPTSLYLLNIFQISPYETSLHLKNLPPSLTYPFGTDELGRNLFIRVCQGASISCLIGLISFSIDITLGMGWGIVSAISSHRLISYSMNKIAEILYSLPYIIIVILISVYTGTGMIPLIVAMCCMGWIQTARVTQTVMRQTLLADYVISAEVLGLSKKRIIFRHILPNVFAPILAAIILSIPQAIFAEAFLSFLGIGIQPPKASLGSLIADAIPAMRLYPWRLFFPAFALLFLLLGITLLADAILEMADPKQRKILKKSFQEEA